MRHRSLVQGFQRLLQTSKQACSCTQAIAGFVPGHLGAGDTPSTSYTVISQYMCEQQRRWHSAPSSQQGQEGPETIDFGFKQVPKDDKVNLVAQVFSNVASSYDVMNDLMSGGMHRLWKDRLVETLRPFPGMHHLDVAGGTGDVAFRVLRAVRATEAEARAKAATAPPQFFTPTPPKAAAGDASGPSLSGSTAPVRHAADSAPPGSVVVCDINPAMLDAGRRKADASSDLANDAGLSFVEGNAEKLDQFADGSFDSYTIAFGIRNVTDRDAALREAWRVLKPGGRLLVMEFSQVTQPGLRDLYDAYSFAVIPRLGALVANDADSYQYLVESIRKFPDQDTFAGMLEDAGFKAVTYENLMAGVVAIHSGFKL